MDSETGQVDPVRASVIIPTYNRKENLLRILDSLSSQNANPGDFEVIVVDDGSTDDSPGIAEMRLTYPLRYFRQANQGSAAARNKGAEQARGDYLIFLDDDMVLEQDFVAGLLEEHRRYPGCVAMGSLRPFSPEKPNVFTRIYPLDEQLLKQRVFPVDEAIHERRGEFVSFTDCVTNNLSIRKDEFFSIGGMQDVAGDGPTWWGDIDFGYRAQLKGFRFRRSAQAFCTHCDQSVIDLESAAARQYKSATLAVALFNKFPALQGHVPMFRDMLPVDTAHDDPRLVVRKWLRKGASTWMAIHILTGIARLLEKLYPAPALLRPVFRWILGGYVYQGYQAGLKKYGPAPRLEPASQAG